MKTAAIILAAAALASAQAPPEGTNKVNCAKPNANYCLSGDIIIRCDANGLGTAGRCSDNVAGYPPLGGVAECWQSSKTSGDAACQKNCVVYAQPAAFTLPASQCQPSAVVTATGTGTPTTLETSAVTSAPQTSAPAGTDTVVYTTTVVNGTVTLTVPCTTAVATSVTGIVIPPPIVPTTAASNSTVVIPPITVVTPPSGTGAPPPPPAGGNQTAPAGSNTPVGPTTTGSTPPVPTGGAVANRATGALVAMGLVAAYLL
ncbi:hypothetical protein TGAM01_v205218 [Trichoderma gamsii]|uniref:Uncharacterized protein n=1 Tax=Trichoderma gamsii TaxID=398673 RepID=A0A0W7VVF0_9HYPO|nr:hypothetical protein TGAM01_v205218 [Trichoderma gamsii]PNP38918.1 hypothetical protein TGAMA5MH_09142 [Trichoderma gamsii]PON25781.1 hypothetical protein TGAM01_v205218 [Trichoderma gamsii]